MEELFATSLTQLESLRVLIYFFEQVFFVIDYSLFSLKVAQKLVVIVLVAHPQIIVQLHPLLLGLRVLQVLLAILAKGGEIPLLHGQAVVLCKEVAVLLTLGGDLQELVVEAEQVRLAVEASFV